MFFYLALCFSLISARTFYFSPNGDDSNNGQSESTPWKTTTKFNSFQASAIPGDIFLFQGGQLFRGNLTITASGTASNPIQISYYGAGENAIFSGAVPVPAAWSLHSAGIYKTSFTQGVPTHLVYNGERIYPARTPNAGSFYYMTSVNANQKEFNDSSRTEATGYFNNCIYRARANDYSSQYATISSYTSPGIFRFNTEFQAYTVKGFGYYLEGKLAFLDATNEWFYDSNTKILYWKPPVGINPNISNVEAIVNRAGVHLVSGVQYVNIYDLTIMYTSFAHISTVYGEINKFINVRNCILRDGQIGVYLSACESCNTERNTIYNMEAAGIWYGFSKSGVILYNFVNNIMLENSLGRYDPRESGGIGSRVESDAISFYGNVVNNTGGGSIYFYGTNHYVGYNYASRACLLFSDCGSIYSYSYDNTIANSATVEKNIVVDIQADPVLPYLAAPAIDFAPLARCYYFDDNVNNVIFKNNTAVGCPFNAVMLHGNHHLSIENNNFVGGASEAVMRFQQEPTEPITDNYFYNNQFIATARAQSLHYSMAVAQSNQVATFTNNFWCQPWDTLAFYPFNTNVNYTRASSYQWTQNFESTAKFCDRLAKTFFINSFTGSNIVPNPSFATDTSGWNWYPQGAGQALTRLSNSGACTGITCGRFVFPAVSGQQLQSAVFSVPDPTSGYYFSYTAWADKPRTIDVVIMLANSPYTDLYNSRGSETWNTTRQTFIRYVTFSSNPCANSLRANWIIAGDRDGAGTIYISNVTLLAATGSDNLNPVFVAVNPSESSQSVTLPKQRNFKDRNGNNFSSQVNLGPKNSVVLFDQGYNAAVSSAGNGYIRNIYSVGKIDSNVGAPTLPGNLFYP